MSLLKTLHKPYPQSLNRWKIIIYISLFIAFFLGVFQPFGLQYVQVKYKYFVLSGYGLVTFSMLLINLIILPKVFLNVFNEDKWTIKKQILWLLWIIVTIGIGNYIYSVMFLVVPWVGLTGFLFFIVFTLLIAIIPIAGVTFISQNAHLKRNMVASQNINNSIVQNQANPSDMLDRINMESGTQMLSFKINEIIYIESEGNYINIWYLDENKVKNTLIRNTIKRIEALIDNTALFKCHRAFIVNLQMVEKVKGNSQGYNLVIKNIEKEIPVARSYTKNFNLRMVSAK